MAKKTADLETLVKRYLRWIEVNHFSPLTLKQRRSQLGRFVHWCHERSITRPRQITPETIEAYQRSLFFHRRDNGKALSRRTQAELLSAVSVLLEWGVAQGYVRANAANAIELPRFERSLPHHVMAPGQIAEVLDAIDTDDALGLRDRAIIEVLYSTGIRRAEVCALQLYDLDTSPRNAHRPQRQGRQRPRRPHRRARHRLGAPLPGRSTSGPHPGARRAGPLRGHQRQAPFLRGG